MTSARPDERPTDGRADPRMKHNRRIVATTVASANHPGGQTGLLGHPAKQLVTTALNVNEIPK